MNVKYKELNNILSNEYGNKALALDSKLNKYN